MSDRIMPAVVNVLLHLYTLPGEHPMAGEKWFAELMQEWIAAGIVVATNTRGPSFILTERGDAWVELILSTPMPVNVWADPRTKTKGQTL